MKKVLFLLLILCCAAQGGQGMFPPAKNLAVQAAKATVKQYPDADSVLLYDRETIHVEPDGGNLRRDCMALKILTEKGRRDCRVFRFYFSDEFEKVTLRHCSILRNGKTIMVDLDKNSRLSVESSQMSSNIYDPHQKILALTVPDVRIGDIILLEVEELAFKPRMKGIYCGLFGLQGEQPVQHYEIEISVPEKMELRSIAVKNEVVPLKSSKVRSGGRIVYRWSVENVPQVIPEPQMPPVYLCAQRLLVSTAKDYSEVSRWYDALCRPRLAEISPEMKKTVAELTEKAQTTREKADAVFQFVSQKVRYMGITEEKEVPGYEPHPVKLTFEKRYGVCRDKAALLVAMLRMAGLDAYPVLFSAGHPKDGEVPNNYFNHAVAAVKLDGKIHLMDPTCENTREWLPSFEREMSYLIASPAGDVLQLSPAASPEENGLRVATRAVLDGTGKMQCESSIVFRGADDQIYRGAFVREKKEFQREFFAQVLQKILPGAVLDELELFPRELRDMSSPFMVKLKFHCDLPGGGPLRNLPLPVFGSRIGITAMQLRSCSLQKRTYPLELAAPSLVHEKIELALPGHLCLVSPRSCEQSGKVLSARCAVQEKDGRVKISRNVALQKKRVPAGEYPELKKSLAELDRFDRGGLLLKGVADLHADMEILRHDTAFELIAEDSAAVTTAVEKKILTYAGIKNGSELHFSFNPAQEELNLVHGEVVDSDGTVHPLAQKEQNLMDAPGTDAAPAYSPNKILAVSFPGVKPGSVLRYTVKRTLKKRPGIAFMQCFAGGCPIRSMSLTVRDRTGKLLQKLADPAGVIRVTKKSDGTMVYSRQDIPAVKEEMHAVSLIRFAPAVLLGNSAPKNFAEKLSAALAKQTRRQPKAAALAKKLVKGRKSDAEKIRIIRDFVARTIRRAGPALNELPYTAFNPADVTLSRGYGSSADCAILLGAMLSAADLPAEFFALSDLPFPEERYNLLAPLLFDRIMVRSRKYILNGSSQYAPLTIQPFSPGAVALTLPEGRLFRLYPDAAVHRHFEIRLQKDGAAEIRCTLEYSGRDGETMNRRWSEMTPLKREQFSQKLLTAFSHTAGMIRAPEWRETTRGQFQLCYTVKIPDLCTKEGEMVSFELPGAREFTSLLPGGAEKRTTPIDWRFPSCVTDEWRILLPGEWHFARLPESRAVVLGGMLFHVRAREENGELRIRAGAVPLRGGARPVEAMLAPQTAPLLDQWKKTFEAMEQRIILVRTSKEK